MTEATVSYIDQFMHLLKITSRKTNPLGLTQPNLKPGTLPFSDILKAETEQSFTIKRYRKMEISDTIATPDGAFKNLFRYRLINFIPNYLLLSDIGN